MIYFTNDDRNAVFAISDESELSYIQKGVYRITIEDRDKILESLKPPITPDMVRYDRNNRLDRTQWLMQRHRDEIEFGCNPTLSHERYVELNKYRQELRDVPDQVGFPSGVVWPSVPTWLE